MTRLLGDANERTNRRDAGWRQAARFRWTDTARATRDAWGHAREHRRSRRG
jgi:hypothetical protein